MATTALSETTGTQVNPYAAGCATRRILDRVGDRWTVLVGILSEGDARFSEVRRRIEGVSRKMLTQTLRGLERDGLVPRTVYPEVPVRVEYALTDLGLTLCAPLRALCSCGRSSTRTTSRRRRRSTTPWG